ncbi:MAG: D-alanine--D-alanine ligase [Bacteroidetes bacterium]|nr:D-alanine--D-alanine ligase [Bacteroidota bacterium]
MKKLIGIIYGGKSTEHEISIISATNVYKNLDKDTFDCVLLYISKDGGWYISTPDELMNGRLDFEDSKLLSLKMSPDSFCFINAENCIKPDVLFPVLHGPNGEDGSVQGLFEVAGIPYVGTGIAGSSIAMDKEIAKRLLIEAGIPVANYFSLQKWQDEFDLRPIIKKLGFPMVVKPCSAGSSVGLSKVNTDEELIDAIELAFEYDEKILLEEYIEGREIEVAVMGNHNPISSTPGEIVTAFYDYKEKYSKDSKTRLDAPAVIDAQLAEEVKELAIDAFLALNCEGMSRVDFFLTEEGFLLNEINTIPGFTNISMYPKLFEISGISQKELISRLIEFALDRWKNKAELKTYYTE